jgi:hypothetical protein
MPYKEEGGKKESKRHEKMEGKRHEKSEKGKKNC